MSGVRIGGAVVLAGVAVFAALLAADVRGWHRSLAQGDAVYTLTPGRATWTPSTRLGGLAGRLLGTNDDLALRRALQLYARAASIPNRLDTADERQALRAQAQTALARVAGSAHVSQAEALLGVLAFDQTTGVDAALADFTNAVRADPSNTSAKYDLELLLRLTTAHGSRAGAGPGGSVGAGGRRGAGGGGGGSGY